MSPKQYKPAYVMVVDSIRARIRSGELKPGDKLPTKREMAEQFIVSGQVIDSAILVLKQDGTIEGRQGKGIYVAESPSAAEE
jgi:DNA-binding GntR family transcriptional regulator